MADYEAVLKLEPSNKTAISGVNKLRKPYESRKIRWKFNFYFIQHFVASEFRIINFKVKGYYIVVVNFIFFPPHFRRMNIEEENIGDDEDKVVRGVKSERTVETNGTERPKQRVNNDICYCDRAPGSSQSVATKPHLKTSYCVETGSNKAAAADAVANKSTGKTTRGSSRGDKLSPVAKDFGGRSKTLKSHLDAVNADDIFAISRESFPGRRGVEGKLGKSIFSCVLPQTKPSTVIIEELSSDEVSEIPGRIVDPDETRKKTSPVKEKSISTKKSYINKNKELISLGKESRTKPSLTPNKIQIVNECEKARKNIDSNETKVGIKKRTTSKEEKDVPIKRSDLNKSKKIISPQNESKIKTSVTNKITSKYQKEGEKLEMELQV